MSVDSLSSFTVTLGGVPLTCVPPPDSGSQSTAPAYRGRWVPQDATRTFVKRDVPAYIKRFSKGTGFVERRDEGDDDAIAWAEDAFTHLETGIMPSGRRIATASNLGLALAASAVTDSVIFDNKVWCLQTSGRLFYYDNCDPASAPVYSPALNAFGGGADVSFRAGFAATAMAVFATAAGVPALYVATVGAASACRMYQYTAAGGWTEGVALLGFPVFHMAVCWWEDRQGVGALRLHVENGANVLRHCIYGTDPTVGANYVTPITVGNPAFTVQRLVAAPEHLFAVCTNGIHDFNEQRSWNLTPTWEATASAYQRGGILYDDHIYGVRGYSLDRYDLRLGGAQDRRGGACGPLEFMGDGTPIRGAMTANCVHDGWLLQVVENPDLKTAYLMRGKDRRMLNVDVRNPMVWFGAEQVLQPVGGTLPTVTQMMVSPAGFTSYLWMFVSVGGTPYLYYAPLPTGSGPLSLQASGATFAHNPTARIYHTALNWDDRSATKGVHRIDLVSRKTSATSTIEIKSRADGPPETITDQTTWTSQGTHATAANTKSLVTAITGQSIALQTILTTPSPYTSPPIICEISPRARVVREALEVRDLWIVLERDYELADGQADIRSPDSVLASIVAFQQSASAQTFIDETATSCSAYVEQAIEYGKVQVDEREWRTTAHIELSLVA